MRVWIFLLTFFLVPLTQAESAVNFELKAADVIRVNPKKNEYWVSGRTPVYEKGKLVGHKNPCGDHWEISYAVSLVLSKDASERLSRFTSEHLGEEMRLIFEGTPLISAKIVSRIEDGRVLVDMGQNEKAPQRMQELVSHIQSLIRP